MDKQVFRLSSDLQVYTSDKYTSYVFYFGATCMVMYPYKLVEVENADGVTETVIAPELKKGMKDFYDGYTSGVATSALFMANIFNGEIVRVMTVDSFKFEFILNVVDEEGK